MQVILLIAAAEDKLTQQMSNKQWLYIPFVTTRHFKEVIQVGLKWRKDMNSDKKSV